MYIPIVLGTTRVTRVSAAADSDSLCHYGGRSIRLSSILCIDGTKTPSQLPIILWYHFITIREITSGKNVTFYYVVKFKNSSKSWSGFCTQYQPRANLT